MRLPARFLACIALTVLVTPALSGVSVAQSPVRNVPAVAFDDVLFTNVDTTYGLAVDPVTGDLWYGSGGGLVRVSADASERRVFGPQDGLPVPLVFDVAFDADGVLWAATDAGLARVDARGDDVVIDAWTPPRERFAAGVLLRVAPADDGTVWVGTRDKGLAAFDPVAEEWQGPFRLDGATGDAGSVVDLAFDGERVLAAAKGDGFLVLEPGADALTLLDGPEATWGSAYAVLRDGDVTWYGTDRGLWRLDAATGATRHWNGTALSNVLVTDIARLGDELHVTTAYGVTQFFLDDLDRRPRYFGANIGLPSNRVSQVVTAEPDLVYYATLRGVLRLNVTAPESQAFVTGPTNGPNANVFYRGIVHKDRVWFATAEGVAGYDPVGGAWANLGILDGLDASARPVFDVKSDGDALWLATQGGVYRASEDGEWTSIIDPNGRNRFPSLAIDDGIAWLPEPGQGLLEHDWQGNRTVLHNPYTGLLDTRVNGVVVVDDAVYAPTYSGLYKFDKTTREWSHHGRASGLPSLSVTDAWVHGKDVWLNFVDDGLARFSTVEWRVTQVLNASSGTLPGNDVRDLVVDGKHLWLALGRDGVARVDPSGADAPRTLGMADGLTVPYANGLVLHEDVLYVGTVVGVDRVDVSTGDVIPPSTAPARSEENATSAPALSFPVRVSVDAPVNGDAVTGNVTIRGTAAKPGATVDRVEVRVDEGPWQVADGVAPFTFTWHSTRETPGWHNVTVRAIAGGEVSKDVALSLRVVPPPETPLTLAHHAPTTALSAERPVPITAQATGDAPLSVTLYYKPDGATAFKKISLAESGGAWVTRIPAGDAREGTLTYYLEAQSGYLKRTLPEDTREPFTLTLEPAPPATADLAFPVDLTVDAGATEAVDVTITNTGDATDTFGITVTGARAQWVTVEPVSVRLAPGDAATLRVTLTAPADALAADAALAFHVTSTELDADAREFTVPLRVDALPVSDDADDAPVTQGGEDARPKRFLPAPGALVTVSVLAGAVALFQRRGRE